MRQAAHFRLTRRIDLLHSLALIPDLFNSLSKIFCAALFPRIFKCAIAEYLENACSISFNLLQWPSSCRTDPSHLPHRGEDFEDNRIDTASWAQLKQSKHCVLYQLAHSKMPYRTSMFGIKWTIIFSQVPHSVSCLPSSNSDLLSALWTNHSLCLLSGALPILEFDGLVLAQSLAIARFLAREFGKLQLITRGR